MTKTNKFQKAYYHGLLVQVEDRLETLALVRFDGRLLVVPTEDLKEVPYHAAAAAKVTTSAAVSNRHY